MAEPWDQALIAAEQADARRAKKKARLAPAGFPRPVTLFSKARYLYLVREVGEGDFCFHKVGIAQDVHARICQLQVGNGRPLSLENAWHCALASFARRMEAETLAARAPQRMMGEWLYGSIAETVTVIEGLFSRERRKASSLRLAASS